MRLPFVSRARYDEVVRQVAAEIRDAEHAIGLVESRCAELRASAAASHEAEMGRMRGLLDREAGRVDALTKVILRLKSTGAVLLPPSAVQATRGPARELSPIERAIDDNPRARANAGLTRQLFKYADQAKRDGVPEEDVLEKLRTWGQPTHDDDAEDDAL